MSLLEDLTIVEGVAGVYLNRLAPWASAAQPDEKCCDKLKALFREILEFVIPGQQS